MDVRFAPKATVGHQNAFRRCALPGEQIDVRGQPGSMHFALITAVAAGPLRNWTKILQLMR
jgi:hypothetical protein